MKDVIVIDSMKYDRLIAVFFAAEEYTNATDSQQKERWRKMLTIAVDKASEHMHVHLPRDQSK